MCLPATFSAGATPAPIHAEDLLSLHGTRFFLDGKPYAEISFNKFDLFWAIWQASNLNDPSELARAVARQDSALRDLHATGFRTIRIFGAPWSSDKGDLQAMWNDPVKRQRWLSSVDTTLGLCEKNQIQVVFSLGLGGFSTGADAQHASPLYTAANSSQRQLCYSYIDAVVSRFKDRKAIAMWEVSNELTNAANIGDYKGLYNPTLDQVAAFFDATARRIKQDDPLRLVSTGGAALRTAAWHRWRDQSWQLDSLGQYREAYSAYFAHSAIDVVDTHYYELRGGENLAPDSAGKPVALTPGDYVTIANTLGKGAIMGEYGTLPSTWDPKERNDPDWFHGYHDPNAAKWVQRGLDQLVSEKIPITYWWAYQSDRPVDQFSNPATFSMETTPNLVRMIAAANQRLKMELGAPATSGDFGGATRHSP